MDITPQVTIQIRQAHLNDIPSLTNLLKTLFSIEEDFTFNEERQKRGLQLLLENRTSHVLVAQADDTVVGMCSGQLTISTAEGSLALLAEDVVVQEKWRGRGIGRNLVDSLAHWGQKHGACRMQLLADRHNEAALTFYTRLGWRQTQLICLRKRQGETNL